MQRRFLTKNNNEIQGTICVPDCKGNCNYIDTLPNYVPNEKGECVLRGLNVCDESSPKEDKCKHSHRKKNEHHREKFFSSSDESFFK